MSTSVSPSTAFDASAHTPCGQVDTADTAPVDTADSDADADSDSDADTDNVPPDTGDGTDEGGCNCDSGSAGWSFGLLGLAALVLHRRR
jgi:MYXO-CTERM domain-containing protein